MINKEVERAGEEIKEVGKDDKEEDTSVGEVTRKLKFYLRSKYDINSYHSI